jgi:hypothetical protein
MFKTAFISNHNQPVEKAREMIGAGGFKSTFFVLPLHILSQKKKNRCNLHAVFFFGHLKCFIIFCYLHKKSEYIAFIENAFQFDFPTF